MNLARVVDRFRGDGKSPFKPYRLSTLFLFPNKFRKDTVICVICVTASRNHLINKALQNYARKCFCVTDRHLPSPYRHRRRQSRRILRHPNGVLRHLPSPAAVRKAAKIRHFRQRVTQMTQMTQIAGNSYGWLYSQSGIGLPMNLAGMMDKFRGEGKWPPTIATGDFGAPPFDRYIINPSQVPFSLIEKNKVLNPILGMGSGKTRPQRNGVGSRNRDDRWVAWI